MSEDFKDLTGAQERIEELEAIILRIGAHLQTASGSGDEAREHMRPVIREALRLIGVKERGGFEEWADEVSALAIKLGLNKDPEKWLRGES